mgnify:CR=1 FL=1
MRINPFFYIFIFFNFTVFLPIVITGLRVYLLWYSPLADTGQSSFLHPFLLFVALYVVISCIVGFVTYKLRKGRFILVSGPMRVRSVIKATLRDKVGRIIVITYSIAYFISYLIVSGLLLVPNINVSPYFLCLTQISYEGNGIQLIGGYFVLNYWLLTLGVFNDVILTLALILGYYIMSLIYVSLHAFEWKIPKSFRIMLSNNIGGFLTASVPSIGTIAGICCLTPTAINSLLFLISSSYPTLTKGVMWKYGTFIAGAWTGGILQAIFLSSPTIIGVFLIGVGIYEIYKISQALANRVRI